MGHHSSMSGRERVARHRAALRAMGLRPRQFWVPDTRSGAFAQQAQDDCAVINAALEREDDLRFAEAVQHWPD